MVSFNFFCGSSFLFYSNKNKSLGLKITARTSTDVKYSVEQYVRLKYVVQYLGDSHGCA